MSLSSMATSIPFLARSILSLKLSIIPLRTLIQLAGWMDGWVDVCACVRVCVGACACVCVCV